MNSIRIERRVDGAAILWFDTPESSVNILSKELLEEIRGLLDEIEKDPAITACVLASTKKDFIAGANLQQIAAMQDAAEGEAFSRGGHALLDRLAASRKPFVAAIAGQALGGGLEVALACHYRLAADDPSTVLALPEVQLGLLPGGGGTQRLPRLVGLATALPMMLTGQRIRARKALRMGLVDALTSPGGIVDTAAQAALDLASGRLRPRRPKRPIFQRLLETWLGRAIVFRRARVEVLAKTRGLYPAPIEIIECVRALYARSRDKAFAKESHRFGRLVASPESKALIGLFNAMTDLKKPAPGARAAPVRRLAIVGGGFMGQGIASVSLKLAPVTVKDVSDAALSRCGKEIWDGLSKQVRSGSIGRFERDQLWAHLFSTTHMADLGRADLVIEAVFEDLSLKQRILAEVEDQVRDDAVFASNTSALPIASIAAHARRSERVLGMHYFSPVPKMPLLEIIVTERTAPDAVATARAFGVQQGKTVIVVRDGPGFYTTRILAPYMNEAIRVLEEGAKIEEVDGAMKDFGYPVGPLALLDEVGIDVAAHVVKEVGQTFADRGLAPSPALSRIFEAGYHGRKNRRGFYVYASERGRKRANAEIYAQCGGHARGNVRDVADRLSLLMVNEAILCLQEGVVSSPRDGDVGAILGLGFPPFRGGPFRYADAEGASELIRRMTALAERHGERFRPAALLEAMARSAKRFYPD